MSSPNKSNTAVGKTPVPDITVVSDEESNMEDEVEIKRQAKEARRKVAEDHENWLEATRTKAQCQKEKEEAKAKADAEEVRKQKEANNLFQEVAKPGTGKGM